MTRAIENILLIEKEKPKKCQFCGKIAETRPYGPNGEDICFDCGMSTPMMKKAAEKKCSERL